MKRIIKLLIIVEVLMAVGALLLYLANRPIKDEWYHVAEVSDMQEYFEGIPLQSIDCYWYVKEYSLGGRAYLYGISGKITVSDEYLEEIKSDYADWEKQADIYYTDGLYKQHLQEYSCTMFKDFWKAQNYLMSEAFNNDRSSIMLLSEEGNDIYFYRCCSR